MLTIATMEVVDKAMLRSLAPPTAPSVYRVAPLATPVVPVCVSLVHQVSTLSTHISVILVQQAVRCALQLVCALNVSTAMCCSRALATYNSISPAPPRVPIFARVAMWAIISKTTPATKTYPATLTPVV